MTDAVVELQRRLDEGDHWYHTVTSMPMTARQKKLADRFRHYILRCRLDLEKRMSSPEASNAMRKLDDLWFQVIEIELDGS